MAGQTLILTSNLRIILAVISALVTVFILRSQLKRGLRPLQYGIIGLVTITAVIHLLSGSNDILLYLNGVGYMVLLTALYFAPLGQWEKFHYLLHPILIGYTLITIILYYVIHPWGMHGGVIDVLGWATKGVEILLVVALLVDMRLPKSETTLPLSQS